MRADEGYGKKRRDSRTIILAILTAIAVIGIGVIGLLFVQSKMKEKTYSESIKSAEKYLEQNNYEDAIIAYRKAISTNPEEEEGYLALADVYTDQEEMSEAQSVLEKGYARTKSPKIKYMIDTLARSVLTIGGESEEKKNLIASYDLDTASANITWNMPLIQKLESFDFDSFKNEFGNTKKVNMNSDGYLEVVHQQLGATCYYKNTEDNKSIVDTSRKIPENTGMPEKISLKSIAQLFRNFEGGVTLDKIEMMAGTTLKPMVENGKTIIEIPIETCLVRVQTDKNGNIVDTNAWNEIILLHANQNQEKIGHLSGTVINAATDEGVKGATLTFVPSDSGLEMVIVHTGVNGTFSIDLEPDTYQMTIAAEDYIEESFEVVVENEKTYSGEVYTISPELTAGSARIVLEWGATPTDLDSYLSGNTDSGESVFTSFRSKQYISGGKTLAELDVDNVEGYGPETTTVYDLKGSYHFLVADYNRTGTMKNSGATVKVYLPDKDPVTITIDSDSNVNDIWQVFELDHGELSIINEGVTDEEFDLISK